jgi:hypothetical protein
MSKRFGVLPVALVIGTLLTAPACAAQRSYRYSDRGLDDRAYRNGYDEGRGRGERDARKHRRFDYERYREFRNANDGYRGNGDRTWYHREYRRGFAAGYEDGYRRFARDRWDRR